MANRGSSVATNTSDDVAEVTEPAADNCFDNNAKMEPVLPPIAPLSTASVSPAPSSSSSTAKPVPLTLPEVYFEDAQLTVPRQYKFRNASLKQRAEITRRFEALLLRERLIAERKSASKVGRGHGKRSHKTSKSSKDKGKKKVAEEWVYEDNKAAIDDETMVIIESPSTPRLLVPEESSSAKISTVPPSNASSEVPTPAAPSVPEAAPSKPATVSLDSLTQHE